MSTRATIIAQTDDGYAGIYLHHDGYPSGAGKVLRDHYTSAEKVAALIELGDLSSLDMEIGERKHRNHPRWCLAYGRDFGETDTHARRSGTVHEIADMFDCEYTYVFADGKWTIGPSRYHTAGSDLQAAIKEDSR